MGRTKLGYILHIKEEKNIGIILSEVINLKECEHLSEYEFNQLTFQIPIEDMTDHIIFRNNFVVIYNSDDGSPDHISELVHRVLKALDSDQKIDFEWGIFPGEPNVDFFGGGAGVITKNAYKLKSTHDLAVELRQEV